MADESDPGIVAEIPKNSRELLRVTLSEFKGHKLLHLRIWTKGEQTLPTKSGFAVQLGLIPEIRAALERAEQEARQIGWLEGTGGQQ
jgi:hypothetical protein